MIKINDKKCGAGKESCKVIGLCPVEAISYIEVEEPLHDREVECSSEASCSCSCGCDSEVSDCGKNPFARIVVDTEKCIVCGICIEECCGQAIYFED